ncbi:MAG: NUDIX domain-containing protein [Chitinivibrionales bacterium]|nr:NUDIX domain-containing protein [Chitinivibrionales bacterium]
MITEYSAAIISRGTEILMLRRAPSDPPAGKWCPPNEGIIYAETPRHAVIRGVKEETNLNLTSEQLICDHYCNGRWSTQT